MIIVGITGGIGAGKSTVAKIFSRRGAKVIDADKIVHRLLKTHRAVRKKLIKKFGRGILASSGIIDRKKLAGVGFHNLKNWRLLCKIIHPEVIKIIKQKIEEARKYNIKVLVIDAPLLIETGLDRLVDYVILVKAHLKQASQRARFKLKISEEEFKKRRRFQLSFRKKFSRADFVIDNTKTLNFTERQVGEIWKKIINNQNK
ncbi:MAG: dephospho-CoA kinase [Candidatus Omnitrophota bacterium]